MPDVAEFTRENRERYLATLESGEVIQTTYGYHKTTRQEDGTWGTAYCSVGAILPAMGVTTGIVHSGVRGLFYDSLFGLDLVDSAWSNAEALLDHIVDMNDKRDRSFEFVAKFLRRVWQMSKP